MEWFCYFILGSLVFGKVRGIADDEHIDFQQDCLRDYGAWRHECAVWSGHPEDSFQHCVLKPRVWQKNPKVCGLKYTWLKDSKCQGNARITLNGTDVDVCSLKAGAIETTGLDDFDYLAVIANWDKVDYRIRRSYLCCEDYPNKLCCDRENTIPTIEPECTDGITYVHYHSFLKGVKYVPACSFSLPKPQLWCEAEMTLLEKCTGGYAQLRVYSDGHFLADVCSWKVGQKGSFAFGRWSLDVALIHTVEFKVLLKFNCKPPLSEKKEIFVLPRIVCNPDKQPTIIKNDAILTNAGNFEHDKCEYVLEKPLTCESNAVEIFPISNLTKVCKGIGTNQAIQEEPPKIRLVRANPPLDLDLCQTSETFTFGSGKDPNIHIKLEYFWEYYIQVQFCIEK